MHIVKTVEQWRELRRQIPLENSIGFVPTMGCLHAGHASLIRRSCQENLSTVVSIFINPTQFNNQSDLLHYPKTLQEDFTLLEAGMVDFVFLPTEADMYPDGNCMPLQCRDFLSQCCEGAYRLGHFDGVVTIVMKLFQLVQPTRAYFGEKDYQQLKLIQQMVRNYFLPIDVVACPTIRMPNQLPYSSRNSRLTENEQQLAGKISQLLHTYYPDKHRDMLETLAKFPIQLDYLETLHDRLLIAYRIGEVRLIDNVFIQR